MNNRIIKFRIWDKLAKKFITPESLFQGHYALSLNGRFCNFQDGSGGDEYEVMEFTGLIDKAKIPIYEGDIVKFTCREYEHQFLNYTGEVWYDNDSCCWMFQKCKGDDGLDYGFSIPGDSIIVDSIEIIGNICENKALLK